MINKFHSIYKCFELSGLCKLNVHHQQSWNFYDFYGNGSQWTEKMCIRWLWFIRLTLCCRWPLTALCRWQMQKLLSFGTICLSKLRILTQVKKNTRKLVLTMSNNGRFGVLPIGLCHALKRCKSKPIQAHTQKKHEYCSKNTIGNENFLLQFV